MGIASLSLNFSGQGNIGDFSKKFSIVVFVMLCNKSILFYIQKKPIIWQSMLLRSN